MPAERLENLAALRIALLDIVEERGCNAAAIECWSLLPKTLGVVPCLVVGELSALGVPVACETDVHGAISSIILQAAGLHEHPTFFADLTTRHPDNDNAELLWHCGPFPYALKDPSSPAAVAPRGEGQWRLRDGDVTIARFDSLQGRYSLFAGEARTTDGPKTNGTYVWVEMDDWERWEKKFIYGPYIHHVSCMYGKHAGVLAEACRFIDGLEADGV
jgi:L-fucose isomerase-like protein